MWMNIRKKTKKTIRTNAGNNSNKQNEIHERFVSKLMLHLKENFRILRVYNQLAKEKQKRPL